MSPHDTRCLQQFQASHTCSTASQVELKRSDGEKCGWTSLVAQMVKYLLAMWETRVQSLDWKDPLEKRTATYSSIWPGEFHGLYSPWGRKESDTTEWLSLRCYSKWTKSEIDKYHVISLVCGLYKINQMNKQDRNKFREQTGVCQGSGCRNGRMSERG